MLAYYFFFFHLHFLSSTQFKTMDSASSVCLLLSHSVLFYIALLRPPVRRSTMIISA